MFKFMQMINGVLLPPNFTFRTIFFFILGQNTEKNSVFCNNILLLFTFYMLGIKKETVFSPGLRRNLDKVSVFLFDSLFVGGSKYTV